MKIWIFIFLLSGLTVNKAFATDSSVIDGKVKFIEACSSCPAITPESWEINLSTTLVVVIDGRRELGFRNYSEWIDCQNRAGLRRKYRQLQTIIDSHGALPASLTQDLRERAGWLRSYYLSLP